jgi:hypothetical protein
MKTVTISLTKYSDFLGRLIRGIDGSGYSHASISIDGKEEIFYSFNYKGFAIEKPKKYWPKKKAPGTLHIRIQVRQREFERLKKEIDYFIAHRKDYKFSNWGIVLCVLGIPHKFDQYYFCSQFVAEVLKRSGVVKLNKPSSVYLPNHFRKIKNSTQIVVD